MRGTLFTVQKALPLIPAGGAIVINGSMVSIKGFPVFSVYTATKAAVRSFARTWVRGVATPALAFLIAFVLDRHSQFCSHV